jgi:HEAT repeat protein
MIGDSSAVEALVKALEDKDWNVRGSAAWALGEIGDVRAVSHLTRLLGDKNWIVRSKAVEALGKTGDVEVVQRLTKALGDEWPAVSEKAAETIIAIGRLALEKLKQAHDKEEDIGIKAKLREIMEKIEKE